MICGNIWGAPLCVGGGKGVAVVLMPSECNFLLVSKRPQCV